MRKLKRMLLLLSVLLSFSCILVANPNKAIFLIPEGFTGGVIILYNQPDGIVPETSEDGTIVYRIPKDGFLKVKPPLKKVAYRFNYYFVDANDKRTEIEYLYPEAHVRDPGDTTSKSLDSITEDEKTNGIFVINHITTNFNNGDERVYLYNFLVEKPNNSLKTYLKTLDKIDEIDKNLSTNKSKHNK